MGTVDRAKSGLAKIGGAAALVEIGRQLWPVVKPAVERGRQNAAAWRTARAHADRVRRGSYLDVYVDGVKHWVVWSDDEPVAAYPPIGRDLAEAVSKVDLDRRRRPGTRKSGGNGAGSGSADAPRKSLPGSPSSLTP
jgi:hypothetical protein